MDPAIEITQAAKLAKLRAGRDQVAVDAALAEVRAVAAVPETCSSRSRRRSGCEPRLARSVMRCVMFGGHTARKHDCLVTTRNAFGRATVLGERLNAMSVSDRDSARRAEIVRLAGALNERLIAIRRDIHAHPEIGNHEHRTTALIVDDLERLGSSPKCFRLVPEPIAMCCRVGSMTPPVSWDCAPTLMR